MSNHEITPFGGESPNGNYSTRCLCVLVLDTSYSMSGERINELNKGLSEFGPSLSSRQSTRRSVETAIVTFDSIVNVIQQPGLIEDLPEGQMANLQVNGTTKMAEGLERAFELVENRKAWYKAKGIPYFRPWVVLVTDGAPDPDQDMNAIQSAIQEGDENKKFAFLPMGVKGADMNLLSQLATKEFPPLPIDFKKFGEVFKWLSSSFDAVSTSVDGKVTFDPVTTFIDTGWGGGSFTQTSL